MESKRLTVGVIGVGHLGQHHARILSQLDGVQLVGVSDQDETRGHEIAQKCGVPFFDSVQHLIDQSQAISLVTPTVTHHQLARQVLMAGKHLFVEKPITATVPEADELVSLAQHHKTVLQVGHIERFNAAMVNMRKHLSQPRFVEVHRLAPFKNRATDVGVVVDLMIHDLDLLLNLVGELPERVEAVGVPVMTQFEDIANARVTFANGCVANVTASRITPEPMRRFRVFQRDAYFSLDFQKSEVAVFRKQSDGFGGFPKIAQEVTAMQRETDALTTELLAFVDSIQSNKPPIVSGAEGRQALALAVQITDLIRQGFERELHQSHPSQDTP